MSIEVVISDEQLRALVQILTDQDDSAVVVDVLALLEEAKEQR